MTDTDLILIPAPGVRKSSAWLLDALKIESPTLTVCDQLRNNSAPDVHSALLLAPLIATGLSTWDEVQSGLEQCFVAGQSYIKGLASQGGTGGNLIAILPASEAMGEPGKPYNSALVGGVLSLLRTWTLELRGAAISVNSVMIGDFRDRETALELAQLVLLLVGQRNALVTGQEIFAAKGIDAGRLHP